MMPRRVAVPTVPLHRLRGSGVTGLALLRRAHWAGRIMEGRAGWPQRKVLAMPLGTWTRPASSMWHVSPSHDHEDRQAFLSWPPPF